jgi:hypothetical protein
MTGVSILAALRPDSWNVPLLLHVGGAMILVGGMLTGAAALAFARGATPVLRTGYYSLLAVALPGFVLMRTGAGWIEDKEGFTAEGAPEPTWLGIGYLVADLGGLLFLVSLVVGGVGVYRLRDGRGGGLLKVTMAISLVLLAAYVVAVWAMSAKPD